MEGSGVSTYLRDNYKNYYEHGDSEWRRLGAIGKVRNIVDLCGHLNAADIIEIGAGEGSILKRMSDVKFGEKMWAVEISSSGVSAISRRQIDNVVECRLFDGYHIPYGDGQFDLAILSHVLEHVEYPRMLIYEAARVAKHVFIEVPLEDTARLPWDFTFDAVGHIDAYSPRSIRRLVQSCGMVVEHQITSCPTKEIYAFQKGRRGLANFYLKSLILWLWPGIATRMFTYNGALLFRKAT